MHWHLYWNLWHWQKSGIASHSGEKSEKEQRVNQTSKASLKKLQGLQFGFVWFLCLIWMMQNCVTNVWPLHSINMHFSLYFCIEASLYHNAERWFTGKCSTQNYKPGFTWDRFSSCVRGVAGGFISPSEWSEDAFLFLFLPPTRVMVLEKSKKQRTKDILGDLHKEFINIQYPAVHIKETY